MPQLTIGNKYEISIKESYQDQYPHLIRACSGTVGPIPVRDYQGKITEEQFLQIAAEIDSSYRELDNKLTAIDESIYGTLEESIGIAGSSMLIDILLHNPQLHHFADITPYTY